MESQSSSWIDREIQEIIHELAGDTPAVMDERTLWTFIRYAYGKGYTEGLRDRGVTR